MKFFSLCYHYIRKPDDEAHFPRILGTKISDFEDQIKKFKTKFDFLNLDDIYNMYYSKKEIRPRKPGLLLTFDDGLSDHFEAAKILYENNIQATFFIPTCILRDQLPANPNIIHYCIAQFGVSEFLKIFYNGIDKYGPSFKKYPIEFDKSIDDPTPTYFSIGLKFNLGFFNTLEAKSIEGQPVTKTELGSSPILITRSPASFVATKCRLESFVIACLTFSSIEPVTSPPWI